MKFNATFSDASPRFAVDTIGDGNCLYRAIARACGCRWYGLKAKALRAAVKVSTADVLPTLRRLQKRNTWGDEIAIAAVARYLQRPIVVFKDRFQCVFTPARVSTYKPICLRLSNMHFETVCAREGVSCMRQRRDALPMSFSDFTEFHQMQPTWDELVEPVHTCIKSSWTYLMRCSGRSVPTRYRLTRKMNASAVFHQTSLADPCHNERDETPRMLRVASLPECLSDPRFSAVTQDKMFRLQIGCDSGRLGLPCEAGSKYPADFGCNKRFGQVDATSRIAHPVHEHLKWKIVCMTCMFLLSTLRVLGAGVATEACIWSQASLLTKDFEVTHQPEQKDLIDFVHTQTLGSTVWSHAYDVNCSSSDHNVPYSSLKPWMPQLSGGVGKGRGLPQPTSTADDTVPFVPASVDISRIVQKLKGIPHGLQTKQIRAIVIADSKVLKRLQAATDVNQLKDIVLAAAARFNMFPALQAGSPAPVSDAPAKVAGKGKGGPLQIANNSIPSMPAPAAKQPGKGKGKGKGKSIPLHSSLKLCAEGWNVGVFDSFQPEEGAVYVVESAEKIRELALQAHGKAFPIAALAPFPVTLNEQAPQALQVEFTQDAGGEPKKILMQAFLHQLTASPVTYDRQRAVLHFPKPDTENTQVLHVRFNDAGAPQLIIKDLQLLKLGAARQWLESLLPTELRNVFLDMWKLEKDENGYKINIRVPHAKSDAFLKLSGPGHLQIHASAALRTRIAHVWLKTPSGPMTPDKVKETMTKYSNKHLGAFELRGCWALRALADDVAAMRSALGQDTKPSFFIKNVPSSWVESDMTELLVLLKWDARIQPNSRRWFKGCTQWIVRAESPPPSYAFPIYFGYERRMVYVSSTKRNPNPSTNIQAQAKVEQFNTWKAQLQTKATQPKIAKAPSHGEWTDLFKSPDKKRRKPNDAPVQPSFVSAARPTESSAIKLDSDFKDALIQQLQVQVSEQQKQIQELTQAIQTLTNQISGQSHFSDMLDSDMFADDGACPATQLDSQL